MNGHRVLTGSRQLGPVPQLPGQRQAAQAHRAQYHDEAQQA